MGVYFSETRRKIKKGKADGGKEPSRLEDSKREILVQIFYEFSTSISYLDDELGKRKGKKKKRAN